MDNYLSIKKTKIKRLKKDNGQDRKLKKEKTTQRKLQI
jgi:hypothetical protein